MEFLTNAVTFFLLCPLLFFVNSFAIGFGFDLATVSVKSLVKRIKGKRVKKDGQYN